MLGSVKKEGALPRAKASLQLAMICSLSSSEIHSPNKASTVPALKVGMDADRRGGVEEGGVKGLWLLGEASSVVRAVGGGHLSGGEYSSCPCDIIIHYFHLESVYPDRRTQDIPIA